MLTKTRIGSERGITILFFVVALLGVSLAGGVYLITAQFQIDAQADAFTQNALREVAAAISSAQMSPMTTYQRSYEQDVRALPSALADLQTKPGPVAACSYAVTANRVSGWCGPYFAVPFSGQTAFVDAWGRSFVYSTSGRRVYSRGANGVDNSGGGDDISQTF